MLKQLGIPAFIAGLVLAASPGLAFAAGRGGGGHGGGGHAGGGHAGGGGHAFSGGRSGGSGGGHSFNGSRGGNFRGGGFRGGAVGRSDGRGYRGDRHFDRDDRWGGGGWGGGFYPGLSFGYYGAPYDYGYSPYGPDACGYYDQWGRWVPTAGCYAYPYGY